jgi:hypothetical protein
VGLRASIERLIYSTHRLNLIGNQVTQLSIPVDGGNNIFAWLVTPLKLYAKHKAAFRNNIIESSADFNQTLAVRKLAEDPQNRLIIYCKSLGSW